MTFLRKNVSLLVFVLVSFAVRWSFADHYRVPSGSMEPTIQVGDHIFTNKMAYDLRIPFTKIEILKTGEPQRGDVVVFSHPLENSTTLVKRLIGLPGDEISIIDGFVFVNGLLIEGSEVGIEKLNSGSATNSISTKIVYTEGLGRHSYSAQRIPSRIRSEQLRFKVPADHFFFMGDNRDNSSDSRAWGFAPRKNLKGQAIGVLWSVRWEALLPRFDLGRVGVLLN